MTGALTFRDQEQIDELTKRGLELEAKARWRERANSPGEKLYIITTAELFPIKVGITQKPSNRLSELQVGNWHRLHIHSLILCPDGKSLYFETLSHGMLAKWSLSGEWYGIEARKAEMIIAAILAKKGYGLR